MRLFLVLLSTLCIQMAQAAEFPVVVVTTTMGIFEVELNDEKAPVSVANFLAYVDSKFYSDTLVHRVVKNFVIQGGGLDTQMSEKATLPPIINEANNGLSNLKGTIGMARTEEIHSATSQFYINTKDNTRLDYVSPEKYGYAVFGKVISGYEVVAAMEQVAVQDVGEYQHVPVQQILVLSIERK